MKYDGPTFPFPTQIHKIWNFILVFTTFLLVLASATEGSSDKAKGHWGQPPAVRCTGVVPAPLQAQNAQV